MITAYVAINIFDIFIYMEIHKQHVNAYLTYCIYLFATNTYIYLLQTCTYRSANSLQHKYLSRFTKMLLIWDVSSHYIMMIHCIFYDIITVQRKNACHNINR